MGRRKQTQPTIPPSFYREAFHVRQDGALCWRERPESHFPARQDDAGRFNAIRSGEPAGFRGPSGRPLVRFVHNGRTRRVAMLKAAWIVATGELPNGAVLPRDGDEWNGAPSNLQVTQRSQNPATVGRSSLERRQAIDAKLIVALAGHPDASVARLGELAGLTKSGACTRLGQLQRRGLAQSPQCCPGRAWALTAQGRELASSTNPVVLDDLDRQVLTALASAPLRHMQLVRTAKVGSLTIRRRTGLMIGRGLIRIEDGKFVITDEGRQALGPDVPKRWVDLDRLRASTAKDVQTRNGHPPDDRTQAFRRRIAALGAQQSTFNDWRRTG